MNVLSCLAFAVVKVAGPYFRSIKSNYIMAIKPTCYSSYRVYSIPPLVPS